MDLYVQVSPRYAMSIASDIESTSETIEKYWNFLEDKRVDIQTELEEIDQATHRLADRRSVLIDDKEKVLSLLEQAQKSVDAAAQVDATLAFFSGVQKLAKDTKRASNARLDNEEPDSSQEEGSILTAATAGTSKRPRTEVSDNDEVEAIESPGPHKKQKISPPPPQPSPKKPDGLPLNQGLPFLEELCYPLTQVPR